MDPEIPEDEQSDNPQEEQNSDQKSRHQGHSPHKHPSFARKQATKQLRKKIGANLKQRATQQITNAAKEAAKKAAEQAAKRALASPPVLIGLGIAIGILILIFLILALFQHNQNEELAQDQVTVTKTGPDTAKVGDMLNYQINVSYPNAVEEVVIIDHMPADTEYVSSSWAKVHVDAAKHTILWTAKENTPPSSPLFASVNIPLTLRLKALKDNTNLVNWAEAIVTPFVSTGGGGGPGVPPNENTCGGKYAGNISRNRFLPKNFGDPACDFTKDKLYAQLKAEDPANADWWYAKVIPCESGYVPNTWRDPDTRPATPDGGGAWGLFQDGSSINLPNIPPPNNFYAVNRTPRTRSVQPSDLLQQPGLAPNIAGHGGVTDRGDVNWQLQISNAVKLLKERGTGYWSCAG